MVLVSIIFTFIASLLLVSLTFFVLWKDWRDQVSRYYALFAIFAFGILFTMFLTYAFPILLDLTQLNRVTQMATLMTFASLLTFSFVFPKSERRFRLGIAIVILMPAAIFGGVIIGTDLTIERAYFEKGLLVREFKPLYTAYAAMAFAYIIAAVVNFIRKYLTMKVVIYRLQMRYVFLGSSISLLVSAFFSIILPRFFNYPDLYVFGPSVSTFLTVAALFYSIIAYHLMDITTVAHKTLVYLVISMVISLPIFVILFLRDRGIWLFGEVPAYLAAGVIVVIFIVFSIYIQPLIDRAFKRRQYEFGGVIDRFIRDLEGMQDLRAIISRVVDVLFKNLVLERAFFLFLNERARNYELVYSQGGGTALAVNPVELTSSLIRWFVRNQELLLLGMVYTDDRSFGDIREDITGFFTGNGVQMILPIYHERRLVGLLCLGNKENLAGYRPEEIEKLELINARSNDFISAAITFEKAMKEQLLARSVELSSSLLTLAMPAALPSLDSIKFGAFVVPKYAKGSDYFDFVRPGDQGIGVVATDLAGLGVQSALSSVLLRSSFHASLYEAPSTGTVMQNLNRVLFEYSRGKGGMVTAFYLYYDIKSTRLMYTNAGFPALELFRVEKNNFDSLDTEGIPLGYDGATVYGTGRTGLVRGDIGILFTKTLVNARNQKGEEFSLLRLRNLVMENRARGAAEIAERIRASYEGFMGLVRSESDVITLVFKIV